MLYRNLLLSLVAFVSCVFFHSALEGRGFGTWSLDPFAKFIEEVKVEQDTPVITLTDGSSWKFVKSESRGTKKIKTPADWKKGEGIAISFEGKHFCLENWKSAQKEKFTLVESSIQNLPKIDAFYANAELELSDKSKFSLGRPSKYIFTFLSWGMTGFDGVGYSSLKMGGAGWKRNDHVIVVFPKTRILLGKGTHLIYNLNGDSLRAQLNKLGQ